MSQKKAWDAKAYNERAQQSAKDRARAMSGKKAAPAKKKSTLTKAKKSSLQWTNAATTSSWAWTTDYSQPEPIELNLPAREQIDPIRVFKLAKLVWADGRIRFMGVGLNIPYDAETAAMCGIKNGHAFFWGSSNKYGFDPSADHDVPDPRCTCGFHGVASKDADEIQGDYASARFVRIEAELYGRVVRHERGYRAEHQRVLSVSIPRRCRAYLVCPGGIAEQGCTNTPTGLRIDAGEVIASCAEHAPFGGVIPPTDVAKALGTQVRWFDQSAK